MMTDQRFEQRNAGESAEFNDNMRRWKELLRSLPDVRMEKVDRAKRSLCEDSYEDDGVIEVTLDRLHGDIR